MNDLFDGTPIKALTLWQPWASLMAAGLKIHETRHWATSYRGLIGIHAGLTVDVAGAPYDLTRAAFGHLWHEQLPRGAMLAIGRLTACVQAETLAPSLTRADRAAGNYAIGRFAGRIDNIQPLIEPLPMAGRQGLYSWTPPEGLAANLGPVVDHQATCQRLGWLA